MSTSFCTPPTSDPALSARTFVRNPTLAAALQRLAQNHTAQSKTAQPNNIMGGQESSGSDAAPEPPAPPTSPVAQHPFDHCAQCGHIRMNHRGECQVCDCAGFVEASAVELAAA